ncbi:MAG: NAD(+) diphosphatase [Solirubrobacterales bacterium]|nr:NAD(+) diphosphatase [Solirubrobacterales bacterium]MBV9714854.1 NAD(+) diphosphatase [Solirubrobacterales bacterium]
MELADLRHPELLTPTFTGMGLDRAQTLRKDPSLVERRLRSPASRAAFAGTEGVLLDRAGERVARRPLSPEWRQKEKAILLGLEDDVALFALDLDSLAAGDATALGQAGEVVGLRDAGARLSHAEGGLAAYMAALLNWHRKHRFCANCGAATEPIEAGSARRCECCGTVHFPRTDPVVIMRVENDGRLLLGHRTGWPAGRYSCLAGFVSPGESAEEAVLREVREESGIAVHDPVFVASQPWPFPASLMLGFAAYADDGVPAAVDGELDRVEWFTREQLHAAAAGRSASLKLPPPISIARFLIDRWLAGGGVAAS